MARKCNGRRLKSLRDIAHDSGLTLGKVHRISMMDSWRDITVGDATKFSEACGVDLMRPNCVLLKMRILNKVHLSRIGLKQKRIVARLIRQAKLRIQTLSQV